MVSTADVSGSLDRATRTIENWGNNRRAPAPTTSGPRSSTPGPPGQLNPSGWRPPGGGRTPLAGRAPQPPARPTTCAGSPQPDVSRASCRHAWDTRWPVRVGHQGSHLSASERRALPERSLLHAHCHYSSFPRAERSGRPFLPLFPEPPEPDDLPLLGPEQLARREALLRAAWARGPRPRHASLPSSVAEAFTRSNPLPAMCTGHACACPCPQSRPSCRHVAQTQSLRLPSYREACVEGMPAGVAATWQPRQHVCLHTHNHLPFCWGTVCRHPPPCASHNPCLIGTWEPPSHRGRTLGLGTGYRDSGVLEEVSREACGTQGFPRSCTWRRISSLESEV